MPSPTADDLRVLQQAARLALALAERLQGNFARHAAASDLTAAQAKLLLALQPGRAVSQRTLAGELTYDPSNLTGLIDRLEARGAVRRDADARDRRVKTVVLTEAGVALRATFRSALTGDPGPLAHLTSAEAGALRDHLARALGDEPASDASSAAG